MEMTIKQWQERCLAAEALLEERTADAEALRAELEDLRARLPDKGPEEGGDFKFADIELLPPTWGTPLPGPEWDIAKRIVYAEKHGRPMPRSAPLEVKAGKLEGENSVRFTVSYGSETACYQLRTQTFMRDWQSASFYIHIAMQICGNLRLEADNDKPIIIEIYNRLRSEGYRLGETL